MQNELYKKIARLEALADAKRAEMPDVITAAYRRACEEKKEEEAAALARKLRDKLLAETDKELSVDRLGLDTSSAMALFASLASMLNGAWAKYRQALRDLPEQEGFPFEIEFPARPQHKKT